MNMDIFNIDNFNVVEDENYYYVFRALNIADSDDMINTFLETGEDAKRIRTDRERYEEQHGRAKYHADSELSLEEITDHIKIHYLKETNCISFSTNANVCLDYGSGYRDQYVVMKVPKSLPEEVVYAGDYMIFEIFLGVEEAIESGELDDNVINILNKIDNAKNDKEIKNIILDLCNCLGFEKDVLSRFNEKQFFNSEQQITYDKIIGKATALEIFGVLPRIEESVQNSTLLSTVGGAFSSGEVVHYNEVSSNKYKVVSKQMMMLFALTQQLKDKYPNDNDVRDLELRLIDLYNNGYDIKEIDEKIVFTNGKEVIDCNILSIDSTVFNSKKIDNNLLSLDSLYEMADGSIDYNKAKKTVEFCYSLASARREADDYAKIVLALTNNSSLADKISKDTLAINSEFIDRGNNHGYRLCESVNVGMNNEGDKFYSLSTQKQFVNLILNLSDDEIDHILNSDGIVFRNSFIEKLKSERTLSKNEYFAKAIVNAIDFDKIYNSTSKNVDNNAKKDKIIAKLKESNIVRLYHAFEKINLNHTEISYYIVNLFLEGSFKGHSFDDLCNMEEIDIYIKNNFSVFNKEINPITLDGFMGIFRNRNFVPDSNINLRDYQQRIKESVDEMYANGRRFAGVVLPTGGGKSFIAMSEMISRKDKKIVYIAPRLEILRQFKKNIAEYVAGCNPEGLSDNELDAIAKSVFPHLEFICYQGLSRRDQEVLSNLNADFIILDEIHHIGSETWNPVVKKLLDHNPESQVLGISATPQRDGYDDYYNNEEYFDMYGGDMMMAMAAYLDNYTQTELLQKKYLACDINVIDAIQEGYVVCPTIISFDYTLDESDEYMKALKMASRIKDPAAKKRANEEIDKILDLVSSAKLEGVDELIEDHIRCRDGKYILFIPRKPFDYEGSTDDYIEEYIEQFKKDIANIDSDPHIDYIHSKRSKEDNETAMKNFELDNSGHIKILVAIDMLNEGVHLPNLSGSFNFRKVDKKHLILALQHLGRVIFALDPDKEITDDEIPLVFDKFNNYSNLDLDRLVNKKSTISDLEKLKNVIFWIEKYGRMPSIDSPDIDEQRKLITLGRLKEKYGKFKDGNFSEYNLSDYDQYNISEIVKIFNDYNFWEYDIPTVDKEKRREIERVNIFKVSAIRRSFIDACNNVTGIAGTVSMSTRDRLGQLIKVLDILAENNILLTPNVINSNMILGDLLKSIDSSIAEDVYYELKRIGLNSSYPIGAEYYFGRINLAESMSIFKGLDYTFEEITNLRKYGLLCNGPDINFIDSNGFIINGPEELLRRNIWTGTYYSKIKLTIDGYDPHNFNFKTRKHRITNEEYDPYGFNIKGINKDTNTIYDRHGFNIDHIHKDTNTIYDPRGFDIDEFYHTFDEKTGEYVEESTRRYDEKGLNIDGHDGQGFDENNLHIKTKKPYDELYFDKQGYYYELKEDGSRVKTKRRYNDKFYDRQGNFYVKNAKGIYVKTASNHNKYGFMVDGLHYITRTNLDPRGFDINGIWHRKEGNHYISTGSIFDDNGFTIEGKTLRTDKVTGKKYYDIVNDYGFDYKHRYHYPEAKIDDDGFVDFPAANIKYTDKIFRRKYKNGIYYDIHGFDEAGNHISTGDKLNPNNFDRDGNWWTMDQYGNLYNTHKKVNNDGFTIDCKYILTLPNGEKKYSPVNEFGFDSSHYYRKWPNRRMLSRYDDFGFDFDGINNSTGTHLDEEGYDRRGIWYRRDANGSYVCTNSRFNDEGWSRSHAHKSTNRIVDEHGFNYLHLYVSRTRFKTFKYSKYDKHNFDYLGINKVTGTHLNRNNFDIDGNWWTTDQDGNLYNTHSKFDDKGLNIDRYSPNDFNSKGTHRVTHKKINQEGFFSNGINAFTNEPFDLNGIDIDGNKVSNVDWNLIKKIREEIKFNQRIYIEQYIENAIKNGLIYDIIDSFDEFTETFDYDLTDFADIVDDIINSCVTKDEKIYTKEELDDYLKTFVLKIIRNRRIHNSESIDNLYYALDEMQDYRYDGDNNLDHHFSK